MIYNDSLQRLYKRIDIKNLSNDIQPTWYTTPVLCNTCDFSLISEIVLFQARHFIESMPKWQKRPLAEVFKGANEKGILLIHV